MIVTNATIRPTGTRHEKTRGHTAVAIGASAGGPAALATILERLPEGFAGAIGIVQHIDHRFVDGLITWLKERSSIPVRAAREGDRLVPGVALVAAADAHLVMNEAGVLCYREPTFATPHKPSIDVFFESLASHCTGPMIGALLTGMGRDGAVGLRAMRDAGARTLSQHQQDCAVYGMPKAAQELNAVDEVLRLDRIAPRLVTLCQPSNTLGVSNDRHR